ncbi:MAG TPA: YidC/Oxa1 family membrane protein insertase [Dehalococcoidia bacterium]|nr:YidC/Oxa1 family membrane protein insertase [Dehalococcoidia bacterium]
MNPWELIILQPVLNILIWLSYYLFNSFGASIIALTILMRLITYPLTARQLRSTKAMQSLQPKIAELQKKYAKDRNALAQEQMKLYKEAGISPAGCLVPMLVQMPIWIAVYQSIMLALAIAPEGLLNLSRYLYPWPAVYSMMPLNSNFLGLDLAATGNFILALLVGASMWVQQKMTTPPAVDPRQQQTTQMMVWMMPMMFFFFSLWFYNGLALYWLASTVIGIAMQYFITGWGSLLPGREAGQATRDKKYRSRIARVEQAPVAETEAIEADIVEPSTAQEGGKESAGAGDKRQDRGAGYPKSIRQIRRQPRSSRRRYPKRR